MLRRILATTLAILGLTLTRPLAPVVLAEEEKEAPESAVSSPPMEMDDPGTPGKKGIEMNFVGSHIRAGVGRSYESLLDANYGIGDRIQLKYERPYVSEGEEGSSFQHGLGATEIGVKWRFVDHNGLEIAMYPQYSFDDGFVLTDENGQPEPTEGRNSYVPLLFSKQIHEVYTAAVNLGYRRNFENHGDDVTMALGGGRAIGEYQRLLVEVFSERDTDLQNRQTDVRLGYVWTMFPKTMEHSHYEVPMYASYGHSVGHTETGELTTSIVFGISVIRKPAE
jgi:hypothetical protein